MNRLLPGFALLLLTGGAGLGVAVTTVHDMDISIQLLLHQVGTPMADLAAMVPRLRTAMDLLVLSIGSGFGLLGVGLWIRHGALQEQNRLEERLHRLLHESQEFRKAELLRLETLLNNQIETTRQVSRELSAMQESMARTEELVKSSPPPTPAPLLNPLVPATPLPPLAHTESILTHTPTPRLALAGPQHPILHDQQDEEFEPF
ncbi:MAG: hypothetical protein G8237_11500 [Magnetococcales bacterium]|nr:hypothetical protein [Magnetococcales bacterium]NGZ06969.1 hypothetical protein [Magnetococcales bacterium]